MKSAVVDKQLEYSIRSLEPADFDQILKLEREIFDDPWPVDMFEEYLDLPDSDFLVAVHDSEIIGYAVIELSAEYGHLTNIAVAKNWRRKSVAKKLMGCIFDIVTAQGREIIVLEVRPSSTEAMKLYELWGFREMYRKPNYYRRPVEEAVVMAAYPKSRTNRE